MMTYYSRIQYFIIDHMNNSYSQDYLGNTYAHIHFTSYLDIKNTFEKALSN